MSLIRYLSVICTTDAKKPPLHLKGQQVEFALNLTLDELSSLVMQNGIKADMILTYRLEDNDEDYLNIFWYGREQEDLPWRLVLDESWMDYMNLCCVVRLTQKSMILNWTQISDLQFSGETSVVQNQKSLYQSILQERFHLKKGSLFQTLPNRSMETIVPFIFQMHAKGSNALDPLLQHEIVYKDEITTGQGVTMDVYQEFWNYIDDPKFSLLKIEPLSNCLIPYRHTSSSQLEKLECLGRIIISSMRHQVYPSRLHPICFGLVPDLSDELEKWIQEAFPEWNMLFPTSYQDWRKVDVGKRQLVETQYRLDSIMDEYELTESNYSCYRIQVFKELLCRHRDTSIQAIRKGMDSMLKPQFIKRCDVTESYKEWQFLNTLSAEDVWDRMDLCRDSDDPEPLAIRRDLLYHWFKDCVFSMSDETLQQFHVFVTGNKADRRRIQVYINQDTTLGYPVAYACSPSITLRHNYNSQEELEKELKWAVHEMIMTLT